MTTSKMLAVAWLMVLANPANAETWTLGYDGVLELSTPATEADLTFRLCDAEEAGACAWEEAHTGVPLVQGHFAVRLGTGTATDGQGGAQPGAQPAAPLQTVLETNRWMEVVFEGTALVPRVALDAVPLAVRAGDAATLAGQGPGAFATAGHGHDDRYPTDAEVQATVDASVGASLAPLQTAIDGKAEKVHGHPFSEITGQASVGQLPDEVVVQPDLTAALAGYYDQAISDARFAAIGHAHAWAAITGKPTTFPAEGHAHDDLYYPKAEVYTKTEADARYRAEGSCPSDMVPVGDFCVDRYEASVWGWRDAARTEAIDCEVLQAAVDDVSAAPWNWSPTDFDSWYKGQHGTCLAGGPKPALCSYRQYGSPPDCNTAVGCDDYAATWPDTGNGKLVLYGCAIRNVTPSRSITWFQAAHACAASRKRMITNSEWQTAVAGTPDPEAIDSTVPGYRGFCHTAGSGARKTGFDSDAWGGWYCTSQYGVQDMIGNLWEWTDAWGQYGYPASGLPSKQTPWPTSFGFDCTWGVNGPQGADEPGLPNVVIRGGNFAEGADAGAFAFSANIPTNSFEDFGFRCARARLLNFPANSIASNDLADGGVTFADLGQNGCADGQMAKWDAGTKTWVCANDLGGQGDAYDAGAGLDRIGTTFQVDPVGISSVLSDWDQNAGDDLTDADLTGFDDRFVNVDGDTMTGALELPADGLSVGEDQLAVADGSIGIGTTTPQNVLHVLGYIGPIDRGGISIQARPDLSRWSLNTGTNSSDLYGKLAIENSEFGEVLTMTEAGKVGIGTTAPGASLDVKGDARVTGTLFAGCERVYGPQTASATGEILTTATCPAGTMAIGGGGTCSGSSHRIMDSLSTTNLDGWQVNFDRPVATLCRAEAICCRFGK